MKVFSMKKLRDMRAHTLIAGRSEGLISAMDTQGQFHIHPDGTPAYKKRFQTVGSFHEGLAVAQEKDTDNWFHIHPDGRPAYDQRFDSAKDFHNGHAAVTKNCRFFTIYRDGTRIENREAE